MSDFNISFQAALLCDLVRTEITGKAILIGVYSGNVRVSKSPADIALVPYLVGELNGVGRGEILVRVRATSLEHPETDVQVEHSVDIETQDNGSIVSEQITIASPPVKLKVLSDMDFKVYWKRGGEQRWRSLLHKKIEVPISH